MLCCTERPPTPRGQAISAMSTRAMVLVSAAATTAALPGAIGTAWAMMRGTGQQEPCVECRCSQVALRGHSRDLCTSSAEAVSGIGVLHSAFAICAGACVYALHPRRQLKTRAAPSAQRQRCPRAIARQATGLSVADQLAVKNQRLVFFGGKGGVGKTSSSAAYAAGLAEQGLRTLVLSTDPAHSLGDALNEELSGQPREIADNLWAAEVDPAEALRELRAGLQALDAKAILDSMGLPGGTTAALGLNELSELLESPPPGVDEIAAIARAAADADGFDVVVFDTAPTGHTLRMLQVPKFLGDFLDRALSIRKSVGGILGMVGLGGSMDKVDQAMDEAEVQVRGIRARVAWLAEALKTPPDATSGTKSEFVIVTRPTALDCAEAERLITELRAQGVCCRRVIVNQIIEPQDGPSYWNARVSAQDEILSELRQVCSSRSLPLVEVPNTPESLVGVPALTYLASLAYAEEVPSTEVVLFGGKGGVGKTSMSSAIAVKAANEGKRVLVLSTDPAHSLGDALGCRLTETAAPVEGFFGAGELWAMEVDTEAAMSRFQSMVREALQQRENSGDLVSQVLQQLPMGDFVDLFDTLPPGSDEIVALTEVLDEVSKEKFDQIIIDTAPTGHALRLLSFPDFLERLADRVARLRERFGWLAGSGDGPDRVRSFQLRMIQLQDLFADHDKTCFNVVTIPTALAMAESRRLIAELEEQDIKVGIVIANRILDAERAQDGMSRLQDTQQASIEVLESMAKREGVTVTRIKYMDREVRGIHGLRFLATNLVEQTA